MGNFKAYLPHILVAMIGMGAFTVGLEALSVDSEEVKESFVADEKEDKKSEKTTETDEIIDEKYEKINTIYNNYFTYVDLIAKKISEVKENRDIIGDFAIYEVILKNGYISYGDFEYSHPDMYFPNLRGLNVVLGDGVCLNEAHNMADVFKSLGYDARVVPGKYYFKGEEVEDEPNHAVVYVSDGECSYLLDPTNEKVFLKKSHLLYYSTESQEDTICCFEPELSLELTASEEYDSYFILKDIIPDHGKHWLVLKAYKNYKEAADQYLEAFKDYEETTLAEYEEVIKANYDEVYDMMITDAETENTSKELRIKY